MGSRGNIALIGFMGAGKTSVARELSRYCGHRLTFIDTDAEIEKNACMPVSQIFSQLGEEAFRAFEREFCRTLPLTSAENSVIATGGGIVENTDNVRILRQHATLIYLRASPERILQNLDADTSRPLLQVQDKLATITALLSRREPLYRAAAHFIIDTEKKELSEIVRMAHDIMILNER